MRYKQNQAFSEHINAEDDYYAERKRLFIEKHEKVNGLYAKMIKTVIFFGAKNKIRSLLNNFDVGIQGEKVSFRKIKHQSDSMISRQWLKCFTDKIKGNNGYFHILAGDKAINLPALKYKNHNR